MSWPDCDALPLLHGPRINYLRPDIERVSTLPEGLRRDLRFCLRPCICRRRRLLDHRLSQPCGTDSEIGISGRSREAREIASTPAVHPLIRGVATLAGVGPSRRSAARHGSCTAPTSRLTAWPVTLRLSAPLSPLRQIVGNEGLRIERIWLLGNSSKPCRQARG